MSKNPTRLEVIKSLDLEDMAIGLDWHFSWNCDWCKAADMPEGACDIIDCTDCIKKWLMEEAT